MKNALQLRQVRKQFGPVKIIRGVDLDIVAGERHVLIGPNGAGKSTLFHLISGRIAPTSGSICLEGRDITGLAPHLIYRRGLARSFQINNLFHNLSVLDNLRCAVLRDCGQGYAFWRSLTGMRHVRQRAEEMMERIGLGARRDTQAGALAYAEQRLLEIGMTAAGDARILMLDEPTAGMSRAESDRTMEHIRRLSEGRTLLVVEHDMSVVFGLADRISVLVYGEVLATDTPERIRANRAVQDAYLGDAMAQPGEQAS